jgi:hypothetical protein
MKAQYVIVIKRLGPNKVPAEKLAASLIEMKPPLHIGSQRKLPCLRGGAERRMRESGPRLESEHPSPQHASLNYRKPRMSGGGIIW